jgi:cyclic pyranopterin phosphate synthase
MKDARGRKIDYLRVSLTDRCNFRCVYCMPPRGVIKLRHEDMLTLEELAAVVRLMATDLGVTKVRVTGGEPLVRRGALGFLRELGTIPGIRDLSLTTNGFHLEGMAAAIREAGIRRLNISLDTLRHDRFKEITRVDGLDRVLRGIDAAREQGFSPIKLNVVSMRETLDEAPDLIRFGIAKGVQVRFIELMPSHEAARPTFVPNAAIREAIEREYRLVPVDDPLAQADLQPASENPSAYPAAGTPPGADPPPAAGPPPGAAQLYRIHGHAATCGFISPITQPFCATCNRIRLRGDAKLLPCLSTVSGYDLMPFIRPRLRLTDLAAYLEELLPRCKMHAPKRHEIHAMSMIGG